MKTSCRCTVKNGSKSFSRVITLLSVTKDLRGMGRVAIAKVLAAHEDLGSNPRAYMNSLVCCVNLESLLSLRRQLQADPEASVA